MQMPSVLASLRHGIRIESAISLEIAIGLVSNKAEPVVTAHNQQHHLQYNISAWSSGAVRKPPVHAKRSHLASRFVEISITGKSLNTSHTVIFISFIVLL